MLPKSNNNKKEDSDNKNTFVSVTISLFGRINNKNQFYTSPGIFVL